MGAATFVLIFFGGCNISANENHKSADDFFGNPIHLGSTNRIGFLRNE